MASLGIHQQYVEDDSIPGPRLSKSSNVFESIPLQPLSSSRPAPPKRKKRNPGKEVKPLLFLRPKHNGATIAHV